MVRKGMILDRRYELLEQIGSGGMAKVYKAVVIGTSHYVAIKILRSEYNEDEAFVRKFIAEAKSTEGFDHPNIVKIYDAGKEQGLYYIVMELAEGMTLKQYIKRYGRLSIRETVDFSIQLASAIQAAHSHNIVHRDIKPQNIMVSDSGRIKITDFGIAKAATGDTISSNAMGSVRYFSPEQARGGYSDNRSDIYSLGITMYEMATGRVPFEGDNSVAIALMQLQEEAVPPRDYFPDIPPSLENVIMKCIKKRPEERYQTAGDLIDDLERVFECPDGNYVYTDPLVDDSPTRQRTREEIEAVRQSMDQEGKQAGSFKREGLTETQTIEEDQEDDEKVVPGFEKMIMGIAIVLGLAFAGFLVYLAGSSLHLFRLPGAVEETSSKEKTETTTAEPTEEEKVAVPDFLKLSKKKAKERAEKHSLHVNFILSEEAEGYEDDVLIVIGQNYQRGERVAEGTEITLNLGLNHDLIESQIKVPDLSGYDQDKAEKTLKDAGLRSSVIYDVSDTVKEGYVIRQNPQAGTEVDRDFTVTVTISKGLGQARVPSLTGVSKDMAEKLLNDVGLRLGNVKSDYSGSVGVGDVIDQDIPSGSLVEKGTEVSITISLGEEETYHYEGIVSIVDSPFAEEESGSVEIIVEQNGERESIYHQEDVTSDHFPLHIDYSSDSGEKAVAIIYINGEERSRLDLELSAVAD